LGHERIFVIAKREGNIIFSDSHKILLSSSGKTINVSLAAHGHSNKNTCMQKKTKTRVPRGKSIKKGQILGNSWRQEFMGPRKLHDKINQDIKKLTLHRIQASYQHTSALC
jgi:hypothetical protein